MQLTLALWAFSTIIIQAQANADFPTKLESKLLPNLLQVTDSIYSGGTPVHVAGFTELTELGVKTIISVDGAKPDISAAEAAGLRYIHIPIGYDDITDQQKSTLSSVLKKSDPPYYFHCHHGKHRGPAAVASALLLSKSMSLATAQSFMKIAGTSEHYVGLWDAVAKSENLATLPPALALKPSVKVSSMVESMVTIDDLYDTLKALEKNNWQPKADQPDISAAHQALMLLEQFKEMPRTIESDQQKQSSFQEQLTISTEAAASLEKALRDETFADASLQLKTIKSSCIDCHSDHRD